MTVFTIAYNEQVMLPHFIKHYRDRFPNCHIVVFDNESTDDTAKIARLNFCEVRTYTTNNTLSDERYLQIKNNCWRDSLDDWNLICDVDEFLEIDEYMLKVENDLGASYIRAEGWNLVNMGTGLDPNEIKTAVRATSYDKLYLFNKDAISEINYLPGCHKANPVGRVLPSKNIYRCLHFKYLDLEYMIKRHAMFAERLSPENKKRGWGGHYLYSREKITAEFNEARRNAKVIR